MSWKKITNTTKKLIAPDGESFIYPTELWTTGVEGEYLFQHSGKYYIVTSETKYKLKFATNSDALLSKYDDDFTGRTYVAEHCPAHDSEVILSSFQFNDTPAYAFTMQFVNSGFKEDYCLFFSDGKYRMRLQEECNGTYLKKLYGQFYWTAEDFQEQKNYTTFVYPTTSGATATIYTTSNNASGQGFSDRKAGDNLRISSSSLGGSFSIDWASNSDQPPSDWLTLGFSSASDYVDLYSGFAQTEYNISTSVNTYNLYESPTLTGEYTATNESGETITRNVGWLIDGELTSKQEDIYLMTANANQGDL